MRKKNQFYAGFTLIELLVGISVFVIITGTISTALISLMRVMRRSMAEQEILLQLSYTLEYMGRALRFAKKDTNGACLPAGWNYENPGGNISAIRFINHLQGDDCQRFFLQSGTLKYRKAGVDYDLTSPSLRVEELRFQLYGQAEGDQLQPRVTVLLRIRHIPTSLEIRIQTTVSQRNLDIEEVL